MGILLCGRCRREVEAGEVSTPGVAELELASLPFVLIDEFKYLPSCGGVYFALGEGRICYIGATANLAARWSFHPIFLRLKTELNPRIAWLEINERSERLAYEKQAIRHFKPLWNNGGAEHWDDLRLLNFAKTERARIRKRRRDENFRKLRDRRITE